MKAEAFLITFNNNSEFFENSGNFIILQTFSPHRPQHLP